MKLSPRSFLRNRADYSCYRSHSPRTPGRESSPKRNRERGAGRLKAILWLAILASFIYVAVLVLPALINEYQFQDSIQNIARFASANRRSNDQVLQDVLKEAQKDDLPIKTEDIKVEGNSGNFRINVDYSVTVDLKV